MWTWPTVRAFSPRDLRIDRAILELGISSMRGPLERLINDDYAFLAEARAVAIVNASHDCNSSAVFEAPSSTLHAQAFMRTQTRFRRRNHQYRRLGSYDVPR